MENLLALGDTNDGVKQMVMPLSERGHWSSSNSA